MTKLTAPDLDALIEQIRTFLADAPKGKPHEGYRYGELLSQAAAALVQLREENARLDSIWDSTIAATWLRRAERAEAEVARLTKQASAVVVIMPPREPTQEMDDAASNVDRSNLPGIFRRQVWRAMWDASGVAKDSVITGNEP
jgi:hypothetical protein